jgi:NAD(P)-dependent dehydrogenase (short-subunit alcohol dehydrogenase family)
VSEGIVDLKLAGKTALVTGSTAGIGLAIAHSLAREGARVWINGRSSERVDNASRSILGAVPGAQIKGIIADFSSSDGAKRVTDSLDRVDILVNNVGIFEPKPFAEISDDEWLRFFEVNVMSGVRLSRHYLKGMLEKNWGRIIDPDPR